MPAIFVDNNERRGANGSAQFRVDYVETMGCYEISNSSY